MSGKTKLELTWIGKENRPRLEPRILLEDPELSYSAKHAVGQGDIFDNILIQGDNLLALKALEQDFAGKVKCIYIDPPYNTGSAFEHYDDGIEHSIWLSLMRDRLVLLKALLRPDGAFLVQADDNEAHYLKVVLDEVFGRPNFICTVIWQKVDSPNDNKVPITPDHEFIFLYAKEASQLRLKQKVDPSILAAFGQVDEDGHRFRDRLLKKNGKSSLREDRPSMYFPVTAPDGSQILPVHDDGREACWALGKQGVLDAIAADRLVWKDRGSPGAPKWVPYTREWAPEVPVRPYPTIWTDVHTSRQAKAHQKDVLPGVSMFATPKPELLISRILEMTTSPGDLVLDSFAGSGTTAAVAHKMGRRWISVELGEHARTHCIPRLQKVVDGEDPGGVTSQYEWTGGGGFRFYHLAPSLLEVDKWGNWIINKSYNKEMLAEAMCKLQGFRYAPSPSVFWQHGQSSEQDYIYVTTQTLTQEQLEVIASEVGPDRTLLICCAAFRANHDNFPNLTITKIPAAVLVRCEWGKDDYSLNVRNVMGEEPEPPPDPDGSGPSTAGKVKGNRTKKTAKVQDLMPLFAAMSKGGEE